MKENEFYTFSSYIKDYDISPNEEDYIEMIYRLSLTNSNGIKVTTLASALNIKAPSVTKMIKKLKEKGILTNIKYGTITLTPLGVNIADKLLYRHNTIENFLKLLGEKNNILEKTEKIEHVIDSDTLILINKLLKYLIDSNYKVI